MADKIVIPKKLSRGDHIRVICPSRSLGIISEDIRAKAIEKLSRHGNFRVSFGKHVEEIDEFNSSSIQSRVHDIHEAFLDTSIQAILTGIGGYNANQLLRYLDFDLIKNNPKIICGFSDVSVITNVISSKTGLVTYSGPHFSTWGMEKVMDYTIENFLKICAISEPLQYYAAEEWSDDKWFLDQDNREFLKNPGYQIFQEGSGLGKSIGGHARSLAALQGTSFFPDLEDSILFLEEDEETNPELFDRILESLTQQENFDKVKAILIGRFQKASHMTFEKLQKIISTKVISEHIPVIGNVDFGHTTPIITFPVGGIIKVRAFDGKVSIEVIEG